MRDADTTRIIAATNSVVSSSSPFFRITSLIRANEPKPRSSLRSENKRRSRTSVAPRKESSSGM